MSATHRGGLRAAALLLVKLLLTACTFSSPPPSSRSVDLPTPTATTATVAELRAAVARWHRTRATITYRTERQRPGLPESVHQCLRAVVGERTGIAMGLRFCDPKGVITLAWDPPSRWRLDVTEGGTMTTTIVVGRDGIVCERSDRAPASCRSRAVAAILGDVPFRELFTDAVTTARRAGLPLEGQLTVTDGIVAGVPVRCFEGRSGSSAARWCFADDGALLSLELDTDGRAPTIAEAVRVSADVDPTRFDADAL